MDGPILLKSTITPQRTPQAGVDCSVTRLRAPRVPARYGGASVRRVSLAGVPRSKSGSFLRQER